MSDDHYAASDDITQPIDVSEFREELRKDKLETVQNVRRALHSAASSAAQAGKMLQSVYGKIADALKDIDKINI